MSLCDAALYRDKILPYYYEEKKTKLFFIIFFSNFVMKLKLIISKFYAETISSCLTTNCSHKTRVSGESCSNLGRDAGLEQARI